MREKQKYSATDKINNGWLDQSSWAFVKRQKEFVERLAFCNCTCQTKTKIKKVDPSTYRPTHLSVAEVVPIMNELGVDVGKPSMGLVPEVAGADTVAAAAGLGGHMTHASPMQQAMLEKFRCSSIGFATAWREPFTRTATSVDPASGPISTLLPSQPIVRVPRRAKVEMEWTIGGVESAKTQL